MVLFLACISLFHAEDTAIGCVLPPTLAMNFILVGWICLSHVCMYFKYNHFPGVLVHHKKTCLDPNGIACIFPCLVFPCLVLLNKPFSIQHPFFLVFGGEVCQMLCVLQCDKCAPFLSEIDACFQIYRNWDACSDFDIEVGACFNLCRLFLGGSQHSRDAAPL